MDETRTYKCKFIQQVFICIFEYWSWYGLLAFAKVKKPTFGTYFHATYYPCIFHSYNPITIYTISLLENTFLHRFL